MKPAFVLKLAALTPFLLLAAAARADFDFTSQSAQLNPSTGNVTFTIDFNQAPDFFTLDSVGRQANSFQIFVVGDPGAPYPQNYDSIVRGEEIHLTTNELRIRDAYPPVADPAAGGWGALRGEVPFTVSGDVFTFTAPFSLLSNSSAGVGFSYVLESYQYGALTEHVVGETTVTPEPGTLFLLGTGLLGFMLLNRSLQGRPAA